MVSTRFWFPWFRATFLPARPGCDRSPLLAELGHEKRLGRRGSVHHTDPDVVAGVLVAQSVREQVTAGGPGPRRAGIRPLRDRLDLTHPTDGLRHQLPAVHLVVQNALSVRSPDRIVDITVVNEACQRAAFDVGHPQFTIIPGLAQQDLVAVG